MEELESENAGVDNALGEEIALPAAFVAVILTV